MLLAFKSRSGITLIELMIAMLILGLGVVATLGVLFTTGIHNETNKEQALGTKACQEAMEFLTSLPYDAMHDRTTFDGPPAPPGPLTVPLGGEDFKGFILVKKPLANNQYILEFTIRDVTNSYTTKVQTDAPSAFAAMQNMGTWRMAEITVTLKVRKVNVMLKTWRRRP